MLRAPQKRKKRGPTREGALFILIILRQDATTERKRKIKKGHTDTGRQYNRRHETGNKGGERVGGNATKALQSTDTRNPRFVASGSCQG